MMDPVKTIQIKTAPAYDVRIFETSYEHEDEYGPQVNPYLPAAEAARESIRQILALVESDPSEAGDLFVQTYRSVMAT